MPTPPPPDPRRPDERAGRLNIGDANLKITIAIMAAALLFGSTASNAQQGTTPIQFLQMYAAGPTVGPASAAALNSERQRALAAEAQAMPLSGGTLTGNLYLAPGAWLAPNGTATFLNLAVIGGESHYATGEYIDPQSGVLRSVKIAGGGLAVSGGTYLTGGLTADSLVVPNASIDGTGYLKASGVYSTGNVQVADGISIQLCPNCYLFHDMIAKGLVWMVNGRRIARFPDDGSAPVFATAAVTGSP